MLDLVTACWLAFVGASIGSFINVVAYRMPRGMSVIWKPSHCPQCGHDIRPRDNLPVLGWLILRGRCRDCGSPIAPRYAIVEAAMGAAFFLLAYVELFTGGANLPGGPFTAAVGAWNIVWNPNWTVLQFYIHHALLLCVLMAMALIDQDRQRVPWRIVVVAIALALYAAWSWRHLYPERTRTVRLPEVKAQVDALLGIVWGASPWVAAWGVARLRGHAAAPRLRSLALAGAVVGAFLGLRPIVRITALTAAAWLIARLAAPRPPAAAPQPLAPRASEATPHTPPYHLSPLILMWIATLTHLALWKHLAKLASW